jgi:hypothetical protein
LWNESQSPLLEAAILLKQLVPQGKLHYFLTGNEGTFGQECCKSATSTTP